MDIGLQDAGVCNVHTPNILMIMKTKTISSTVNNEKVAVLGQPTVGWTVMKYGKQSH